MRTQKEICKVKKVAIWIVVEEGRTEDVENTLLKNEELNSLGIYCLGTETKRLSREELSELQSQRGDETDTKFVSNKL